MRLQFMSHHASASAVCWLLSTGLALSSTSCASHNELGAEDSVSPAPSETATVSATPNSTAGASITTPAPSNATENSLDPNTTNGTSTSDGSTPANVVCNPDQSPSAGVSRLRRLTREEYGNSLQQLLGVAASLGNTIEPDESVGPFPSNAITPATDLIVEQYQTVAERVVQSVDVEALLNCDPNEDSCVSNFIQTFGTKVFRRPLDPTELDEYGSLFTLARDRVGATAAVREVLTTLLQSPNFLYHTELGQLGSLSTQPTPLTAYELASRVAFFLWKSTPDDELLASAATGSLLEPSTLDAHTQRLLEDPKAGFAIRLFHERLLGVHHVAGVFKDPALFPEFSTDTGEALRQELGAFADYVVRQGDGTLESLFTSTTAFLSEPLFDIYGVAKPDGWTPPTPVQLDASERAGLLTRAAFLATHAHPDQTSPVHRGIAVRENLLCQILPAPPATVNNVAPEPTPTTTTRQRLAQHQADPSCASCHVLIDQIGLGFEHYDPVGRYRELDGSFPVDALGEVVGGGEEAGGEFDGAIELSQKLTQSTVVADCITSQWFRFALGRMESADDTCTLDQLRTNFKANGLNVRTLLADLVRSYAFTHVRTLGTEAELPEQTP